MSGLRTYRNYQSARNTLSIRLAGILTLLFFPPFWILDFYIVPDHVELTFWLRLICTAYGGVLIWATYYRRRFIRRNHVFFAMSLPLFVIWSIAAMCWVGLGYESPYYAGMNMVVIVIGMIFSWSAWASVLFGILTYGFYIAPLVFGYLHINDFSIALSNQLFFVSIILLSAISQVHRMKVERREFEQRGQLKIRIGELAKSKQTIEVQQMSLVASSKMAALGEMAGGIAHEINNPLAIIQGLSRRIRIELHDHPETPALQSRPLIDSAEKIEATVGRIARIVNGLMEFAKDGSRETVTETSLRKLVEGVANLCSEKFLNAGVSLDVSSTEDLSVYCNHIQIQQVLMNLLSNSFDAVKNSKARWIKVESALSHNFVEISVIDSGAGISPEIAEKIMQPFFTTKKIGSSTGLGLSISKGIAEKNGGTLLYDSSGPNTKFVLKVPVAGMKPLSEKPKAS